MKFLLDMGISPRLGRMLEETGHTYRFLPEHYSHQLSDEAILSVALEHDEIVISHDLDFGTILAFSGAQKPSVIVFRIHQINPELCKNLIESCWNDIVEPLQAGAIVVFDEISFRIRLLPVR